MREYSNRISLTENSRGVFCLDTSMGCASGMINPGGCYNDCYAAKSAKLYGYDFSKTVLRKFESKRHERQIVLQISRIKLDFVRIGCSGDPSEDWEHTTNVLQVIARCNKQIVIITKHWTLLTDRQLEYFKTLNICINTSVSALDLPHQRQKAVEQYNRIKRYCKSVLRIVSCDFNLNCELGKSFAEIQERLFRNEDVIDTVFRPSPKNQLVTSGIINVKTGVFNGHKALMSKYNRKTYAGKCGNCKEMCGAHMINDKYSYPDRMPLIKQLTIFQQV